MRGHRTFVQKMNKQVVLQTAPLAGNAPGGDQVTKLKRVSKRFRCPPYCASLAPTTSLLDAPLPAAISLVKDNGALEVLRYDGHSLYVYDRDPAGRSVCVGQCARDGHPSLPCQCAHQIGDWTPIRRTDGSLQ